MRGRYLILLSILLWNCGPDKEFVTESGVKVTYLDHGDGSSPKEDSILILYMQQRNIKDIVFHHSYPMKPLALRYEPEKTGGHLQEVLKRLKVGDSVYFQTTAQNLYEETYKQTIPNIFIPRSTMKMNIRFAAMLTDSSYAVFDRKLVKKIDSVRRVREGLSLEKQLRSDGDSIDAFLTGKFENIMRTPSGLRYVISKSGNGRKIEVGDQVVVHYAGRVMGGQQFDSSRDRNEPSIVNVGLGEVIAGWDEGLTYLDEGAEAIFYIPSPLAYGSATPGNGIPRNAIMVFNIEVLEVKKGNEEGN